MNNLKKSTQIILKELATRYPDSTEFRKNAIVEVGKEFGYTGKDWDPLMQKNNRVKIGTYNLAGLIEPLRETMILNSVVKMPQSAAQMQSIVNEEKTFAKTDKSFVPWGAFSDIVKIVKSNMFYPTYISGLSGNGKTFMVEQACAKVGKEFIRVQINPETDEDDLLGGFRLIDGETVFSKGPVLKAMENGAILLLDEIDRATNKIMCLQGILEGKPVLVKKTGEIVEPAEGFNVIATANTKGKGSEDGRFIGTNILNEAFLERFAVTIEQPYAAASVEKKIVLGSMKKYGTVDEDFATNLVTWSEVIRKTFYDGGVDELISTRRLDHIVKAFAIFKDKMKSIEMCVARFDDDTKESFMDLYTKIDAGVNPLEETTEIPTVETTNDEEPQF